MEKKTTDPWAWGKFTNSVQAVEVKQAQSTLYCSGQVAMAATGTPVTGDMRTQLEQTFRNLEELISAAGFECNGIVRLNVFTTSTADFFSGCVDLYKAWLDKYGVQQATTLIEVKGLFAGLSIELEATVVK